MLPFDHCLPERKMGFKIRHRLANGKRSEPFGRFGNADFGKGRISVGLWVVCAKVQNSASDSSGMR